MLLIRVRVIRGLGGPADPWIDPRVGLGQRFSRLVDSDGSGRVQNRDGDQFRVYSLIHAHFECFDIFRYSSFAHGFTNKT